MKPNNYYLKRILQSVGDEEITSMKSDNWYLKKIAENTGSESSTNRKSSNRYLREICNNLVEINNSIVLYSNEKITQTGGHLDVVAIAKTDGELAEDTVIYFYELEELNNG
jgi:hypothetical protein